MLLLLLLLLPGAAAARRPRHDDWGSGALGLEVYLTHPRWHSRLKAAAGSQQQQQQSRERKSLHKLFVRVSRTLAL